VIIGGLVSSTLLSRVVTPVMYLLLVRHAPAVER
jgi:multidrug efflux pump subunit AcrB